MPSSRGLPVIFIISLLGFAASNPSESNDIRNVRFTSATYNGYISENVVLPMARTSAKHNTSILVRFVDMQKPSVTLETETSSCQSVTIDHLTSAANLRITGAVDLFQLDSERFDCMQIRQTPNLCLCQLQIRLKDDSVRYKLNREAKSLYPLEMKLDQNYAIQASTVSVHILDDNDLEPMFDPSEYEFELNEFDQLPAFSSIGQVFARDPDLGKLWKKNLTFKPQLNRNIINFISIKVAMHFFVTILIRTANQRPVIWESYLASTGTQASSL